MTKVLHIENDPDCLELSRIVLQRQGYEYLSATSVEFGLLQAENERPAMIILSAAYVSHSGDELAAQLQSHPSTKHTPLVFFCSRDEFRQIREKINTQNGAPVHHIEKPTTYQDFVSGIKAAFEQMT
jgi:response regulator RpfG family c-di-GMP phosphodiesterase